MNKGFIFWILFSVFFFNSAIAQDLVLNPKLQKFIKDQDLQDLCHKLSSFNEGIVKKDIDTTMLSRDDYKFDQAFFEFTGNLLDANNDSLNLFQSELLNLYPIGKGNYIGQVKIIKNEQGKWKDKLIYNLFVKGQGGTNVSSLLNYNTTVWKKEDIDLIKYYYRDTINTLRAEAFAERNRQFANRFITKVQPFRFYMLNNYQEILKLIGIEYCESSLGKLRDGLGVIGDVIFSVMNNEDFSHDLFHHYSGTIHDRNIRNWVTEEGIAYSWGNAYYTNKSTGLMTDQNQLVLKLKQYLLANNKTDLLDLFENNIWKDKTGIYEEWAPDYHIGRVIASLICDEVLAQKGMSALNELIICGRTPNQIEAFIAKSEELIGINRKNFNQKLEALLERYD